MKKILLTTLALCFILPHFAHADITSNLIDWWRLDDGGGTAPSDSGSGVHTGSFTGSPTWITGKIGPFALQFAGASSQRVNFGNIDSAFDNAVHASQCAWINRSSTSNIVSFGTGDSTSNRFGGQWFNDGNIYFTWGNASPTQYGYAAMNLTGWHHVCEVFDGSLAGNARGVAYIDGVAASLTYGATPPATLPTVASMLNVYAGYDIVAGYSTGSVDDMRLYSRSISAADVTELYNYSLGYAGNTGAETTFFDQAGRTHGLLITTPGAVTDTCTVISLGMYVDASSATGNTYRTALYDSGKNLLAQGSAATVGVTKGAWNDQTAFSANPTLVGGTSYYVVTTYDSSSLYVGFQGTGSNILEDSTTNYTTGFPNPISFPGTDGAFMLRGGFVCAAAPPPSASTFIPFIVHLGKAFIVKAGTYWGIK